METVQAVLDDAIESQGWNENSTITTLVEYIQQVANDHGIEDFKNFIAERISWEDAL